MEAVQAVVDGANPQVGDWRLEENAHLLILNECIGLQGFGLLFVASYPGGY